MGAGFDLDVDTELLRGCAATVSGAAHDLLSAGRASGESSGAVLGSTATALDVGSVLQRKADEAAEATAQLGTISIAVAQHLEGSAAHFERVDAAVRRSAR